MNECQQRYIARMKASRPDELRRRKREEQRRRRARLYAAGLTSTGAPVRRHDIAELRRVYEAHPAGCPCYDCLYGAPRDYQPTVHRTEVSA